MVEVAPYTEARDAYLRDLIQAVQAAVDTGLRHLQDDPALVDRAIEDCEEIMGVIMAGKVEEWAE